MITTLQYENRIIDHTVSDSVLDIVEKYIQENYNKTPSKRIKLKSFQFDPGGSCFIDVPNAKLSKLSFSLQNWDLVESFLLKNKRHKVMQLPVFPTFYGRGVLSEEDFNEIMADYHKQHYILSESYSDWHDSIMRKLKKKKETK